MQKFAEIDVAKTHSKTNILVNKLLSQKKSSIPFQKIAIFSIYYNSKEDIIVKIILSKSSLSESISERSWSLVIYLITLFSFSSFSFSWKTKSTSNTAGQIYLEPTLGTFLPWKPA